MTDGLIDGTISKNAKMSVCKIRKDFLKYAKNLTYGVPEFLESTGSVV